MNRGVRLSGSFRVDRKSDARFILQKNLCGIAFMPQRFHAETILIGYLFGPAAAMACGPARGPASRPVSGLASRLASRPVSGRASGLCLGIHPLDGPPGLRGVQVGIFLPVQLQAAFLHITFGRMFTGHRLHLAVQDQGRNGCHDEAADQAIGQFLTH